jgi:hypothetical protein
MTASQLSTQRKLKKQSLINMKYLDSKTIESIEAAAFRSQQPFPWANPAGFLTDSGYRELLETMPDVGSMSPSFGQQRKHGQKSHERYLLEYNDALELPLPWQSFIEELKGEQYRRLVKQLMGNSHIRLRFHWHYTPNGCSVSPHCDARGKLGSQIFYMNNENDWRQEWGGETVILNDNGRFSAQSSPQFEDFDEEIAAQTMNNRSLIFGRRGNSWHGVHEIACPDGAYRKVFIVVYEDMNPRKVLFKRLSRLVKGKPLVTEKERAMY